MLPIGYRAVARAYREAAASTTADTLTGHYTSGLSSFHERFVPGVKRRLHELSGGVWELDAFEAFGAGSDVDLMSHVVDAVASRRAVKLFPGDWWGFRVGSAHPERIEWRVEGGADLACLCVPSVRNGHLTEEMLGFLEDADACLLNINLFPTLTLAERRETARALLPFLPKCLLSVSFSRGFGLTVSQLGLLLAPPDHALVRSQRKQWEWFSYFYNAIAAEAFLRCDIPEIQRIDDARRAWVERWLEDRKLPVVSTGTYYVKTFALADRLPEKLAPLERGGRVRLCMKPPLT